MGLCLNNLKYKREAVALLSLVLFSFENIGGF